MSKEREDVVSRRTFAKTAGVIAAVAAGGGAAMAQPAQTTMPARSQTMIGKPQAMTARRSGLSKLSNVLYNSPDERKAFLANPTSYVGGKGVEGVNQADLRQIKNMLADGFCCGGCGCSGITPGETIHE